MPLNNAILAPLVALISKVVPDPALRDRLTAEITQAALDRTSELSRAQAGIVEAEARSESWLTRNWRPLAMVNFLALLNLYWIGIAPEYLTQSPDLAGSLFDLLKIGIGGYVVSRGGEKIARSVAENLRK